MRKKSSINSQKKIGQGQEEQNSTFIEFEPTTNYLYEKLKHSVKCRSKTDRLSAYLKRKDEWERDPFIYHNHVSHNNQSKEGRKLMLCEYNRN